MRTPSVWCSDTKAPLSCELLSEGWAHLHQTHGERPQSGMTDPRAGLHSGISVLLSPLRLSPQVRQACDCFSQSILWKQHRLTLEGRSQKSGSLHVASWRATAPALSSLSCQSPAFKPPQCRHRMSQWRSCQMRPVPNSGHPSHSSLSRWDPRPSTPCRDSSPAGSVNMMDGRCFRPLSCGFFVTQHS